MLAYALMLMIAAAQTDQTVEVRRGTRLEVHQFAGDVIVKVWNRDAVRVEAEHTDRQIGRHSSRRSVAGRSRPIADRTEPLDRLHDYRAGVDGGHVEGIATDVYSTVSAAT